MKKTKIYNEFRKKRELGNKRIAEEKYLPFNRYMALDNRAYSEGVTPVKYKEMMGLTASLVLRCKDCIIYHIGRCVEEGASREEINEALNIGMIVGGSVLIPHLRYALDLVDELFDNSENPEEKIKSDIQHDNNEEQ